MEKAFRNFGGLELVALLGGLLAFYYFTQFSGSIEVDFLFGALIFGYLSLGCVAYLICALFYWAVSQYADRQTQK